MQISPQTLKYLHSKLPIDADENILAVYTHHWFAYVSSWVVGILVTLLVMTSAVAVTMVGDSTSAIVQYRPQVLAISSIFSLLILVGSFIPVYLRSQEQMVLTEEALLQVLQPSLFSSKIDQLGLQHVSDVSVHQDFFGTMFGYGHVIVETPGEQDNYHFSIVSNPHQVAREISQAHENYNAALMGGRMPSTLGGSPLSMPLIDPQQYQQFLAYQQMVAQQQRDQQDSNQSSEENNRPVQ